jgi:O-succinylbenzoic acid--CoA ligase
MNTLRKIIKHKTGIEYDRPALITSKERISYAQLESKIHALGIRQNNKIAIISSNNTDYVIYALALWELNSCIIPLNIRLTDNELKGIIKFSEADFLLVHKDEVRNLSVNVPQITYPFDSEKSHVKAELPGINTDDVSLIMFTSGVSGKPKGVVHSLNNLLNSADNSQSLLSQTNRDNWIASLPFYHIGGLSIIIRAFRFGSGIIIPDSLKIDKLKNAICNLKPAYVSLVATQLKRLLDAGWKPGNELKNLLLGGGIIDEELIKKGVSAGCKISNVYGSTETSAFVTANSGENIRIKPLSAGRTLGNNKITIIDNNLNSLPARSRGEILIEGNTLFYGYYKDAETTRQKLKDGKYLSGDIGFVDQEGDLFVIARKTDLIITGGENVNPAEVEYILNLMPGIKESCVFAQDDKEWGQLVAAAIVIESQLSAKELSEFMKGKIAGYKIPKRFYSVGKIPKTSLGKIMREKVKEDNKTLIE